MYKHSDCKFFDLSESKRGEYAESHCALNALLSLCCFDQEKDRQAKLGVGEQAITYEEARATLLEASKPLTKVRGLPMFGLEWHFVSVICKHLLIPLIAIDEFVEHPDGYAKHKSFIAYSTEHAVLCVRDWADLSARTYDDLELAVRLIHLKKTNVVPNLVKRAKYTK